MINRLQEALEGTGDRESHLAERVAASVADGHRSAHPNPKTDDAQRIKESPVSLPGLQVGSLVKSKGPSP